ncbi:DUF222 domain-containing protein [Spirillospora sp. NPDC048824]|uniref:HNH endonuclease signature motif containing protein n=1 Tax=Spirillospora sp. NPDC048824 TaxID=3364526 RepID=UPI0037214B7B
MPLEIIEGPNIVAGAREWEDREWFPPGPQLAICLSGGKQHLADLTDDELLQVAAAARRQTSWAQARELAAIAELTQRRTTTEITTTGPDGGGDYRTLPAREAVTEEIAAALTVTGNTAATLVHLAQQLTGPLADTGAALETGRIDMAKARVICDTTDSLPDQITQHVQTAALDKAPTQTTGQLRRRIKRIVHRLAPEAAEERKQEAVRQRRLELWDTATGTTDLALCDLAPEDAHGIFNKITAAAHGLKKDGDTRPLHLIRADLATQLLHGTDLPAATRTLLTQATQHQDAGTATAGTAAGCAAFTGPSPLSTPAPTGVAGASARTVPTAPEPGAMIDRRLVHARDFSPALEALAAIGEPPDQTGHETTLAASSDPLTSTVDSHVPDAGAADPVIAGLAATVNRRLTHLRDRTRPADMPAAVNRAVQQLNDRLAPQRDTLCQADAARHGRPGHRPPDNLRREIQERHATCVYPTCNQPSHRCDLDHTVPWRPGITCRCNLAPLCRRHHRLKQTPGWTLHHIWPGLLIWTTPSGAWYIIRPDRQ